MLIVCINSKLFAARGDSVENASQYDDQSLSEQVTRIEKE